MMKYGITSILVPLYNHATTIDRALDSVLKSDCGKIELIVSDDASSDGSASAASTWIGLHKFYFESATIICQSVNIGITANLNALMSHARGEFVSILASDDELPASAVDLQRQFLENDRRVDFVYGNVQMIDANSKVGSTYFSDERQNTLRTKTQCIFDIVLNWSMPWGRLFGRRVAFKKLGNYINEHLIEDRWSALKIASTGKFAYLPEIVYHYRTRQGHGTAGQRPEDVFRDLRDVDVRVAQESKGLLRWLLRINLQYTASREGSFISRAAWAIVRRIALAGGRHIHIPLANSRH